MGEVGKNPWEQPVDLGLRWLDGIYDRMRNAYALTDDKEKGTRAAILIYEENLTLISALEDQLAKVRDFYQSLVEAIRELEEARARKDQGSRTIKGHGCIVVKLVPCGKHCNGCPHGPYAYEVHKAQGRQIWKYLGRAK